MNLRRPPDGLRGVSDWLSQLYDYLQSQEPVRSPNTLTTQTTRGVGRMAIGGGEEGGERASLQFRGQWVPGNYVKDDIVIRGLDSEFDDGTVAGTYIALSSITSADLPPGESGESATANATITGDGISGYTGLSGGRGYTTAPEVTVVGDGAFAEAHAVVSGGAVTSIVIDNPGAGYTSASFSFGAPDASQKWADFALNHESRRTLRVGDMLVQINAGRDTTEPWIKLYHDQNTEGSGSVQILLSDMVSGSLASAGNKIIKLREWSVCVDNVTQKAIFLSSEPYDPA